MASITQTIYLIGSDKESIEVAIEQALGRATRTLVGVKDFSVEAIGGLVDEAGNPSFTVELGVQFEVRDSVGHWM